MHAEACTPKTLTILCDSQEVRELDLVGSSLTASFNDPINVTQITGTAAHTYNIKDEGALVARHSFTNLTRR